MLANEGLFLPTVNLTIDFLAVAHKPDYALKRSGPVPMFPISRASSNGRRNTGLKFTRWSLESQSFSWSLIPAQLDLVELRLSDGR